ncbi:hypothetical protein [Neorhizobium alkalisoli]|uniref:Uncharacterized protein n=1 Tax=Neorhizobium alkalisoli TaxID=528178 RepID=A0A561QUT2_9HYPH|nr:hypothetical protein [Neorhizobium alkalisoli]TWF54144.1 hypothetical protein FHW37_1033 [Neorhizobium alkalisoli]
MIADQVLIFLIRSIAEIVFASYFMIQNPVLFGVLVASLVIALGSRTPFWWTFVFPAIGSVATYAIYWGGVPLSSVSVQVAVMMCPVALAWWLRRRFSRS